MFHSCIETSDMALLHAIFARDPIGAIYPLGDLEPRAFQHCRWWTAADRAVLLLYTGLSVPMVVPFGDVDALRALLAAAPLPESFYTKLDARQTPLFDRWTLDEPVELYVMGLEAPARADDPLPGLTCAMIDTAAPIEALYADYPGNFFDPAQVPFNCYAAAWLDGRVVGAAGTHAYAPAEQAAALGNVVTAADARGRGIARRLVRYLCEQLAARGVRHIGLHVERGNAPAIACYRRLGFTIHSEVTQYRVRAK